MADTAIAAPPTLAVERRFRVMGTDGHVLVVGGDAPVLADHAVDELADLERRWSRFLPDSEISRLNRTGNAHVSEATIDLITKAVAGHRSTGGRYDPTQLGELIDLGYDRPFDQLAPPPPGGSPPRLRAAGATEIDIDRTASRVRLPAGLTIDPGGIGKGLAADRVSADLIDQGAEGVLVNLGGDLRVRGRSPQGDRWIIAMREPALQPDPITTIALTDGAVATSTSLRRRWSEGRHHIVDPRTGHSAQGPLLASVIAGDGWWAEVAATALMVGDGTPSDWAALVATDTDPMSWTRLGPYSLYELPAPPHSQQGDKQEVHR